MFNSVIVHNTQELAMWRVNAWLRVRLLLLLQRTLLLGGSVGRYIWQYHKNLKLKLATSKNKNMIVIEMDGKHFSNELEIFEAIYEKVPKDIKLVFNYLKIIPPTSVAWDRAEHDLTISVLNIFVS